MNLKSSNPIIIYQVKEVAAVHHQPSVFILSEIVGNVFFD